VIDEQFKRGIDLLDKTGYLRHISGMAMGMAACSMTSSISDPRDSR
jgi:hypothetical protein